MVISAAVIVVVGMQDGDDLIERLQSVAELADLSSEDGVLGFNGEEPLRVEADGGGDPAVFGLQLRHLRRQTVQMLLLLHP